ncbi:MAG TPA: hypothetical protein VHO50_04375 [Bacteroidales bacterium]|nr:hypothetical protein [Bacteroidales bacterium]
MANKKIHNLITLVSKMVLYNLRIIFANKFIWFLAGAVIFWMGLSVIYVLEADMPKMSDLYEIFMIFGLLLVFYPSVFGIQNDQDARTIEILFGIPDYRYKIWLVRIVLIFFIATLIMIVFTFFSSLLIVKFNFFIMSTQVMVPVLFLGMLAFALSTVIKNGNGTAVVMIIIGFLFLIMADFLRRSQWNIFLNPFVPPYDMNEVSWEIISIKNRIILISGSVVFLLLALFNLQKREKFI